MTTGSSAAAGEEAAMEPAELAAMLKKWRKAADLSADDAAAILGIPRRTIEGIEQGRGFRYPRLLVLAIASFDVPSA